MWFLSLSKGKQIAWTVFALHLVCLFWMGCDHLIHFTPKRMPISVHTVRILPQSIETPKTKTLQSAPLKKELPPSQEPHPSPKESPKIQPQKAPNTPQEKQASSKPPPTVKSLKPTSPQKSLPSSPPKKSSPNPTKTSLLEEISHSLAAFATPGAKDYPSSTQSKIEIAPLDPLPAPISLPKLDPTEEITSFLQSKLKLPEYGEVKIRLEIDPKGHLLSMNILESRSEKNSSFLKNRLPELQFPCFNESSSLTIVFKNAL